MMEPDVGDVGIARRARKDLPRMARTSAMIGSVCLVFMVVVVHQFTGACR